jgi:hypothetical protein
MLFSRRCAMFPVDLGAYRRRTLKFSGWQICTVLAFLATVQI